MPYKIKLVSDFKEGYDSYFAGNYEKADFILHRMSRTNMSKETQFKIMSRAGLTVPAYGYVWNTGTLQEFEKIVVYTDQFSHSGDGKLLLSYRDALNMHPLRLASEYIDNNFDGEGNPTSVRILSIGGKKFILEYKSKSKKPGEWRSNVGDEYEIKMFKHPLEFTAAPYYLTPEFPFYPIWAIDYLYRKSDKKWVAIDFNTAPGIDHTPVTDNYKNEEIAGWVIKYIELMVDNGAEVYGLEKVKDAQEGAA